MSVIQTALLSNKRIIGSCRPTNPNMASGSASIDSYFTHRKCLQEIASKSAEGLDLTQPKDETTPSMTMKSEEAAMLSVRFR